MDGSVGNIVFSAKEVKKFVCQFEAPQQNDSPEMQISTISLHLGNDKKCSIILRFSAAGRESNFLERLYPEIQQLRYSYSSIINKFFIFLRKIFIE